MAVDAARRRRRRHGDGGNAIIEFVFVAIIVMVPLVYLIAAVATVQRNQLAVTQAARDAGRAFATSDTRGQAPMPRVRAAVRLALHDQGLPDDAEVRFVAGRRAAARRARSRRSWPPGARVHRVRHPPGRAAGRPVGAGRAAASPRSGATSCTSTTSGTSTGEGRSADETGSTIPLILGFFLLAMLMVAGSIALGQAFVQQRDLQDVCDGAAAAAAASSADLDRGVSVAESGSLQFADAEPAVAAYLARDPDRRSVQVAARLSADHRRITLTCTRTTGLAFGRLFGRAHVRHTTTSSARAAVVG